MTLMSLFIATFAFAAAGITQAATSRQTVAPRALVEAQQKMIDGNRSAALKVLDAAIKADKNSASESKLKAARTRLSQMFLTNDGQKKYELAESSRNSGGTGFLSLYRQALVLEPDNTRVMAGYVLGLLAANDCNKALTIVSRIKMIDPEMKELTYLKFRAELCVDPTALTAKDEAALEHNGVSPLYVKIARAQEEYLRGNTKEALQFAREAMKVDAKFPQSYYWAFKALSKRGGGIDEAQRFLYLCRGMNAEIRRHYGLEPQLCAQSDEVEQILRTEKAQKRETN